MNIAFDWYMKHGDATPDRRTIKIMTDIRVVNHAKSCATPEEAERIDRCVTRLAAMLNDPTPSQSPRG